LPPGDKTVTSFAFILFMEEVFQAINQQELKHEGAAPGL
jgi:hypothetical protein